MAVIVKNAAGLVARGGHGILTQFVLYAGCMNSERTRSTPHPLSPRHWPVRFGLGLLWLLVQLPYRWQLALGRRLGIWSMRLSKRRRHIAATNLRLCFPELDGHARQHLLREHFGSLGISALEVALGWWASDRRLRPLAHITGLEHLHRAGADGRGVILLSAHLTCLELGGRLLALYAPFHVMYRPHQNVLVERVQRRNRELRFERAIPRDDARGMLRSLKSGHAVWYASDQNYGHKHSVFAPFFNIPAATSTATTRLARLSGAAVVPFFPRRRHDGSGYELTLLPALSNFPSDDAAADTARINRLIEDQVRLAPEQYLWVHRRFKDRPPGSADLYTASP